MPKYNDMYIFEYDSFIEVYRVISGMAPHKRKMINGIKRMVASKPRFGNIANIVVILAVTVFCQYKSLTMSDVSDPVSFYATVIQGATFVLIMVITQTLYLFTHRHTLELHKYAKYIDQKLEDLDVFVSYRYMMYITYVCGSTLWPLGIICMVMSDRSPWKMFYDFVGFYYPVIIRFVILWFPMTTQVVIFQRFYQLNNCLNRLDDELEQQEMNRKKYRADAQCLNPEFVLDAAMDLHSKLVEANRLEMNTYGLIILVNVIYNLVHFIMGMYFTIWGNSICLTKFEMLATTFCLTFQMGSIYCLGYFTLTEAKNCLVTVGYLNILYSDNKLITMKNAFLLQTLHIKIETDICGLFPLNMSIMLKQLNYCNSFILLLIQYQKSYIK